MNKPILENEIEAKITGVAKVEDNIIEAKEYALKLREYYSTLVFSEEQLADAKGERANINKMVKKIGDYRKEIISEFKKPIVLFETTAKETEKLLKETADYVDVQVKNFENKEKELKKEKCLELYKSNIGELETILSFEKVFNDKWLNKTTTDKAIVEEINSVKDKITTGFKAIEELNSEYELELKNTFLEDYDLTKAIFKNTQLQEQKKALEVTKEKVEEKKQEVVIEMLTNKVEEEKIDVVKTYTLKITAPTSKLVALRQFLELNNMQFEKVEVDK